MYLRQLLTNVTIFFLAVFNIITNGRNVLIVLMCIELMLLSINLNFILFSNYFDDMQGQIFALFILTVAASEAALGLSILILYYRIRGNIDISYKPLLRH